MKRENNYLLNRFNKHIYNNLQVYILLIIIFLIGLALGIVAINNSDESSKEKIITYIESFAHRVQTENIEIQTCLWQSIKRNVIIILILLLLGYTIIGGPVICLLVLFKGYSLSYSISAIFTSLNWRESILLAILIALPYLLYIPSIFIASASGINVYKKLINNRREEPLKFCIIRHAIVCMIMLLVMIAASILESYLFIWIKSLMIK